MTETFTASQLSKLTSYNDSALDALSRLEMICSASISGKSSNTRKSSSRRMRAAFVDTVKYLLSMAKTCKGLGVKIDMTYFETRVAELQQKNLDLILESSMLVDMGYDDEFTATDVNKRLYNNIKRLTPALRDPAKKAFTLENAQTLHDMIRYLHQVGVQALYSRKSISKISSSAFREYSLPHHGKLTILDPENCLPKDHDLRKITHPLIKPIVDLYSSGTGKCGSENFKGILTPSRFITQVHMGCHYAEIEATTGRRNELLLYFKDTPKSEYKNAPHRTAYVVKVLKKLGFKVSARGSKTNATYSGTSDKDIGKKLKEVVRLLMSTKDLDVDSSHINHYKNKVVNEFMKGKTDLKNLLREWYHRNIKDDARIK